MPLQDTLGRRFHYLRLSITDACNYRCNYCLPNGYQKTVCDLPLNLNEIETLVAAFAAMGTRKIRLTGGEPATRHDLPDIIRLCKQTPGIEEVVLTTNGYNLLAKAEQWKRAGLDGVNVSVDSLERETFRRITGHDHLERILAGLEKARSVGFTRLKTNAVLLRQFNWRQFDLFLDLVKTQPVTARFIELMQTGDNGLFFRENSVLGSELQTRLLADGWQEMQRGLLAGPAKEFRHPDYAGKLGLIMPYSKDFCSTCNRLRVSASGKIHLCLFASEGASLRDELRTGNIIGVIRRTRLLLQEKLPSHQLQEGFTGATSTLSMLGG